MDVTQFIAATRQLADEKNLSKDQILDIVKDAFRAAYRKEYGNRDEEIEVELDENASTATILLVKEIVNDDELEDENLQITLTEAAKLKKGVKAGDTLKIDVTPLAYGRIAAQSAKQVIIQRVQEAERETMYEAYKDHENEIIQATVNRTDGQNVYLDLEKATAILSYRNQIPNEHYHSGMQLKIYLDRVIRTNHGPELIISRSHPNLVRELFRLEIPEIQNGTVEIRAIAREAGVRTKIAVNSEEEGIDPVGACVGQKGVRIQSVMDEINAERIDVIQWHADPKQFIAAALAPAEITRIDLNEKARRAGIYVTEDQRALAIGKSGQNVRLAGLLTGYEIDVLNVTDLPESEQTTTPIQTKTGKKPKASTAAPAAPITPAIENIADLEGIDDETAQILTEAGFEKVMQLTGLNSEALQGIDGIDEEKATTIATAMQSGQAKPTTEKPKKSTKTKKSEPKAEEKLAEPTPETEPTAEEK